VTPAPITVELNGGTLIIRRPRAGGYRAYVVCGSRMSRSAVITAEELGELLRRELPDRVTLRRCMTCGEVYGAYAGGEPGMPFSHGYCSEACAGLLPDEPV